MAEGAAFCGTCGQPSSAASAPQQSIATTGAPIVSASRPHFAGFWLRVVAIIIDSIIMGLVGTILTLPLMGAGMHDIMIRPPARPEDFFPFVHTLIRLTIVRTILQWLYFAILESSAWQATIGKKALGLEVTDLDGNRISFGRATGRFFGKILSGLILGIGFLMAGFTEKKQALHDILAGTLVIRKM
jgi:uncharacterized RDD family membrane protein YckC